MKKNLILLTILLFTVGITQAKTIITGGTIAKDSVWTLAGSPYIVQVDLNLNAGKTLTVEPGVTVRFTNQKMFSVYGTLNANSAIFTSSKDTSGAPVLPAKADWRNIYVRTSGKIAMNNCQIKYAGYYEGFAVYMEPNSVSNSNLTNSSITYATHGILLNTKSRMLLDNSNINNCGWAIYYRGNALLTFANNNSMSGNTNSGIYMEYGSTGNTTTGLHLNKAPVPYIFNNFEVSVNDSMLIASGTMLKFTQNTYLHVKGYINAQASIGDQIFFTAYTDDNTGGDTNADGTATSPAVNYWGGVYFYDSSKSTSNLTRCKVSYAGYNSQGGITFDGSDNTVDNCEITNCYYGAKFISASNPAFTNNTITNSQVVPVAISFDSSPSFNNNDLSLAGNQFHAIGLLGGTLVANAVVPKRSSKNIENITYVLLSDVTVPETKTLTIKKGVVIKSGISEYNFSYGITVEGKMTADGGSDSSVVFTSVKDDNFGNPGDTNHDGTQTSPVKNDWKGIWFGQTAEATSLINNCKIKFAGKYISNLYYYGPGPYEYTYFNTHAALVVDKASPTISNTEITDADNGLLFFSTSTSNVSNVKFINSTSTPIAISVSSNPTFTNITSLNGINALGIIGEAVGFDGTIRKRNAYGFNNITYMLLGHLVINSGTNVTVDPGIVLKNSGYTYYVRGGFKVNGSATEKVVFTSIKDDNYGNPTDTNGDGNATVPAANDWGGIMLRSSSDNIFSAINYSIIKFAASSVYYESASAPLNNSEIWNAYSYGLKIDGASNPLIQNTMIYNTTTPIGISLLADPVFVNTNFSGCGMSALRVIDVTLSSNATMKKKTVAGIVNIPYVFDDLTISANAILTINPGITIKMFDSYKSISVNGAIRAKGKSTDKITITSIKDDGVGSDSNNDGNTTAPTNNDWRFVEFNSSALDTANVLRNCVFKYGGNHYYGDYNNSGLVRSNSSKLTIDSCLFENLANDAIGIYGSSTADVKNSTFNNIERLPVRMSMFANPTFSNNQNYNIGVMALGIKGETWSQNATIPKRNYGGFNNITYYFDYYSQCTVNSGTTITIPEGVVFKSNSIYYNNQLLNVNGGLKLLGSKTNPIIFTHLYDDTYGNPMDTQNNGTFSVPTVTGYEAITFSNQSADADCIVKNTTFNYFDYAINLDQASPEITACKFEKNNRGVLLNGVSNPSLDSCVFLDQVYGPIMLSLTSYPRSTVGNLIQGKTFRALEILSETLSQDISLDKKNFGGITNIPYLFSNYTIGSGATLTVKPGVVCKFHNGNKLTVSKGLIAEGGKTADSLIIFTSVNNDYYGGDTNCDSNATNSTDWNKRWYGIYFTPESNDPLCRLKNCVISGTGYYSYANYGALYCVNASPIITNCTLKDNAYGLYLEGASNPVVKYSSIYNNSEYGIYNKDKSFVVNAENNWWGKPTGPIHASNPTGTGDKVSDAVDFTPFNTGGTPNPIMGDVSLNGFVQAFDASMVLKNIVGTETLTEPQQMVADVSGAAGISAYDASLILQFVVGKINCFPAELSKKSVTPNQETIDYLASQQVKSGELIIGNGVVLPNNKISYPLSVKDLNGATSYQIKLTYNQNALNISQIENMLAGVNCEFKQTNGELIVVMAGTEIFPTNGVIANLIFDLTASSTAVITLKNFLANETDLTSSTASIENNLPLNYELKQNYPNPFNPTTTIAYSLPNQEVVNISVYNLRGELVRTLINGSQNAGHHQVEFNGRNNQNQELASGVYLYRIKCNGLVNTKRLMLVK